MPSRCTYISEVEKRQLEWISNLYLSSPNEHRLPKTSIHAGLKHVTQRFMDPGKKSGQMYLRTSDGPADQRRTASRLLSPTSAPPYSCRQLSLIIHCRIHQLVDGKIRASLECTSKPWRRREAYTYIYMASRQAKLIHSMQCFVPQLLPLV